MTALAGYILSPLRQDREHVLYRGRERGGERPVLVLAPASKVQTASSVARLEHEYALRALLPSAWCARPLALVRGPRTALVMEDPGGDPLNQALDSSMQLTRFLRIAISCSEALGHLHARGLVHGDINPANLLANVDGKVNLTGFGRAHPLRRDRDGRAPTQAVGHSFEYMAPEQTGRMNRHVDFRSDLYSLGVTLYQLLVGALPFTASDAIEWMHSHIARRPLPPSDRRSDIPGPVDAIIQKLLAKLPEHRYQTAAGVEHDLRSCLSAWEAHARMDGFTLGTHDFSGQLQISDRLYGREAEIQTLVAALDKVRTQGTCEVVLVSGAAGSGKSSLVNELRKSLTAGQGSFAIGKFEQHASAIPYATVAQALQQLVRPLLGLSDSELGRWRTRLLEALGLNAQLMVNLVPELALIVGVQAPVQDARPQETLNRFYLALRRLLGVFARPERPLVLFLDDLQWADAATLALLARLILERDVPHVLLVGAYRQSEVGPTHPLARVLESVQRSDRPIEAIRIGPLRRPDLHKLLVDALRGGTGDVTPLADMVLAKTGGNPFFTHQFLLALVDEALLTIDLSTSGWRWDLARIGAKEMAANVVDLIAQKLDRLSPNAKEALKHLACLGMKGTSSVVGMLAGLPNEATESALGEATENQLVFSADDGYRFVHDRVREAAYDLIPTGERAAWHLQTARVLASITGTATELQAFEIVNHYNRGAALIDSEGEREQLAHFNLIAGRRARDSTAYLESKAYFDAGVAMLPADRWTRHFRLAFDLELGLAESEFLSGELGSARSRLHGLLARTAHLTDRALVTSQLVVVLVMSGELNRAVEVGLDYLRELGIEWSVRPTDGEVELELDAMWRLIGERPIEALIDLPLITNPQWRATMDVLQELVSPACFVSQSLLGLVLARMVNLSVVYGNCDASCNAYVFVTHIARTRFRDYRASFRFGNVGLELMEERGLTRYCGRVHLLFGATVSPWIRRLSAGRESIRKAFDIASETGDLTFQTYSSTCMLDLRLAAGDPLGDLREAANEAMGMSKNAGFTLGSAILLSQITLIRSLCGLAPEAGVDEAIYQETSFEAYSPAYLYWIRKLQAYFYAGNYAAAVDAAEKAKPGLWLCDAYLTGADYHLFVALSHAAACQTATAEQREAHLDEVRREHEGIAACAELCPENFGDRAALVAAEIARLEGRELDAERLYEMAIRSAHDQGFVHHEALAYELAARFHASRGLQRIAEACLQSARSCYVEWGADGKVAQLEKTFPHLRISPAPPLPQPAAAASAEQIDLETVAKLSQAITSQIELPRLIDVVMKLAIEQAGADRGVLVLVDGAEARVEAEARAAGSEIHVRLVESDVSAAALPESILRYVARTGESLLLADASEPNLFSEDPYIRTSPGRSILCLPMFKQAKLVGQLYLENSQVSDVFTPARFVVLKLLAAQAAISIENARLYASLRRAEASLVRAEQTERDRIARELHDTLLQSTQGLILLFQSVANRIADGDPSRRELEEALDRAQEVTREGRERVAHLRCAADETLDLAQALEAVAEGLAAGNAVACKTSVQGVERTLDREVRDQAYRIGREALANAFRHAGAGTIRIELNYAADEFRLRVCDDGVGIDAQTLEAMSRVGHWGLIGMRERANQMGARLDIRSRPRGGVEIELRVPSKIAYVEEAEPAGWTTADQLQ